MARRVTIRNRAYGSNVSKIEAFIQKQWDAIFKQHIEDLEELADQVESDALFLVPEDTGKLAESVNVRVSKSRAHPGIIAEASAHSRHKTGPTGYAGHDYAPYMEEGEDYDHEKEDASAHFLGGSFALRISQLFEEIAGRPLRMNPNMQHAADYVKDKID